MCLSNLWPTHPCFLFLRFETMKRICALHNYTWLPSNIASHCIPHTRIILFYPSSLHIFLQWCSKAKYGCEIIRLRSWKVLLPYQEHSRSRILNIISFRFPASTTNIKQKFEQILKRTTHLLHSVNSTGQFWQSFSDLFLSFCRANTAT